MCGIIGALAYGNFAEKKEEKIRQEAMIYLTSELLQLTQTRGKDATGVSTMFADCDYMGLKMGTSANEFVSRFGGKESDYDGYLNLWRKKSSNAKFSIGHCRKPSAGGNSPTENNANNHPIKVGNIVGVHNGTLTNHEKIFENLKCDRDGKVDSEAIFRLLHHLTNDGAEPFTTHVLQETCKRLAGTYSVLAFNGNNPYQVAAFRDGRPLEACIIKPLKMLLLASDKDFLKAAVFRYNKMANLYQMGANKFSPLRKDDVDLQILTDDSLYLFDVRDEINKETKIDDLFITEKVPRINKIWGIGSKPSGNYNQNQWNGNNNKHSNVKKTEVKTSPGTTETKDTKIQTGISTESTKTTNRFGMAWNRSSYKYESVVGDEKKHGNIEINCEINSITECDIVSGNTGEKKSNIEPHFAKRMEGPASKSDIQQVLELRNTNSPVDDLISDPAKIDVVSLEPNGLNNGVYSINKIKKVTRPINSKRKQVDVETYPDVLEKSVNATKLEANFSTNIELCNSLEIVSITAMQNMALYSLANRIKNFFYKAGWYSGYISRLNEETSPVDNNKHVRSGMIKYRNKTAKAESAIRAMQTVVKIFDRVCNCGPASTATVDRHIDKVVSEALGDGQELSSDTLNKVFKERDLKKHPFLRRIISSVAGKENR